MDAARGLITVSAPEPQLPSALGLRSLSIGGSADDCADNVCNPYCQVYEDLPEEPYVAERVDVPTGILYGGALEASNVPSAFKGKGSLDDQCSATPGSDSWNEACQFDQHCVEGECVAFASGESGSCEGVDITAPTTCVPTTGDYSNMTVCNRGTVAAPPGINCYRYPGGSPQYPNSDPGLGEWVLTTTQTLEPGECETLQVAKDLWGQVGIQSVGCNPPHFAPLTLSAGPAYPSTDVTTSGTLAWTTPSNAYAADVVNTAAASPQNPSGASTGATAPSESGTFGSDLSWSNPGNAYSGSPAGVYATAAPIAPALLSGSIGPSYPLTYVTPAVSSDTSFANPERAGAADGSYARATPSNPATALAGVASANDASASWNDLKFAYISGAYYATATRTSAGTSDGELSGYGFNLPANAVVDSLVLTAKWKTDLSSTKYTLSAQALTGAANTPIGSALTKSGTYTTETTDSLTVPAATLAAFSAADFDDAKFKVRLRFNRASGSVSSSTASVDYVQVALNYHVPSTTASVTYQGFGLGSVPSNAAVQLSAEVKWKTSAVNANFSLGMQVYTNYGLATQAALGPEVTRTATDTSDHVDTTATLSPSPAELADSSFAVRIRAVRNDGAINPDVTASIDYVRVSLTWDTAGATTTHSIFLKNFGLSALIPENATITGLTATAGWKLSVANTHATLGLQAYTAAGLTPLGSEVTDSTGPTTDTTAVQNVASGINVTDLSDANFGVRVRVTRDTATSGNPDFTAYLDYVTVTVTWTAPSASHGVTFGNFGISVPIGATVTQIKTEVGWKSSAATTQALLGFQPYTGTTPLGSEYTDTTAPTSATTRTLELTGLSLAPAALADGSFAVKLRITRNTGASNPDFTASVDFVRVTVTYAQTQNLAVAECNVSNNWTASKLSTGADECQDMSRPEYVPFTVTRVFQGVCATGGPIWRNFEYTTSTPADTKVEFRLRSFAPGADGTCTALPALTSGDPAPLATASLTQDPEVCAFGTSASCPIDLYAGLSGVPGATLDCLQMDAYGTPSSTATPELLDWNVLYDCAPDQ